MERFLCQSTWLYWMAKERTRKEREKLPKTEASVFLQPNFRSSIPLLLLYFNHWNQIDKSMSKARGLNKGMNSRRQEPLGATLDAAFQMPLQWKSQDVPSSRFSLCHFLGIRPLGPLFYLQSHWVKMLSQLITAVTWCLWRVGDRLFRWLRALESHPLPPPYGKLCS